MILRHLLDDKIWDKTCPGILCVCMCVWLHCCLCAIQVGHLQRSEGVCLWETSQRHGVPLLLPESGWMRCCFLCRRWWGSRRRKRSRRRRSVDSNTHDLIHSCTPPTALRTLHQWQSCKYISQMTYKHCSINWCKCKKYMVVWCFFLTLTSFAMIKT